MRRLILTSTICLAVAATRALLSADTAEDALSSVAVAPIEIPTAAPVALPAPSPWVAPATRPAPEQTSLVEESQEPSSPHVATILTHLRSRHTGLSQSELPELAELIVAEAKRNDITPGLALAVIRVESGCFNYAVSQVGAMGLMQLMPATGEELARKHGIDWHGPDSLFDPRVNITLGLAYLKQLSDRYGSVNTALAAYNWGPGRIDRRLRRGQSVPKLYATQVMNRLSRG